MRSQTQTDVLSAIEVIIQLQPRYEVVHFTNEMLPLVHSSNTTIATRAHEATEHFYPDGTPNMLPFLYETRRTYHIFFIVLLVLRLTPPVPPYDACVRGVVADRQNGEELALFLKYHTTAEESWHFG